MPKLNNRNGSSIDPNGNTMDIDFSELESLHIAECDRLLNMKVAEETTENKEIRVRVAEQAFDRALETPEALRIRIAMECLRLLGTVIVGESMDDCLARFRFLERIIYLAHESDEELRIRLSYRRQGEEFFFVND